MSQRGKDFIEDWVWANVFPSGYPPEETTNEARVLVEQSLMDANRAEVSQEEIEEEVGALVDYIQQAIKLTNDVGRVAARNS